MHAGMGGMPPGGLFGGMGMRPGLNIFLPVLPSLAHCLFEMTCSCAHSQCRSVDWHGVAMGSDWVAEAVLGARWVRLTGVCLQGGCRAA